MKRLIVTIIGAAIASVMLTSPVFAGPVSGPVIRDRMENQQDRIVQGVQSGELTVREAAFLEAEQARIRHDAARMTADGRLTARERVVLTREQNQASRDIYRLKHNRWQTR